MKLLINKLFIFSFLIYLLCISSGLSVSHIYCSNGERWILGSEMPAQKNELRKKSCSNHKKEKDQRQKNTYSFDFKFDRKNIINQNFVLETNFLFHSKIVYFSNYIPFINTTNYKILATCPNSRFKPELTILQVFRI